MADTTDADQPTTWPAPPKVPAPSPSSVPVDFWKRKAFGLAITALVVALGSGITGWVSSRSAEKTGVTRSDYGWNAVRSELDRQSKATADLAADVKAQREWLAALLRAQQVSAPVVPSPSAPPVVVMAQPGGEAPDKRTLTPLASSLPELPAVKASPSSPALPKSLSELVRD